MMTHEDAHALAHLLSQEDDDDTWCVCCSCMQGLVRRLNVVFHQFLWDTCDRGDGDSTFLRIIVSEKGPEA